MDKVLKKILCQDSTLGEIVLLTEKSKLCFFFIGVVINKAFSCMPWADFSCARKELLMVFVFVAVTAAIEVVKSDTTQ